MATTPQPPARAPVDPSVLGGGILADALGPQPLFCPDPDFDDDNSNIDPTLLQHSIPAQSTPRLVCPAHIQVEETASTVIAEEVSTFLENQEGSLLSEALDQREQERLSRIVVGDDLSGLDEVELDRFILNDEEVRIKERVWVELNKDYLEALAGKYITFRFLRMNVLVLLTGSFSSAKGDQQEPASKSRKVRTSLAECFFLLISAYIYIILAYTGFLK